MTAYVGNESDADVYFDDVRIEHRQGRQVQETHYDPVGLELAGLAPHTPGLKPLNQYQFNGQEFQADLGLNWNHHDWRFFDPQLGRWHTVDPLADANQEMWSPYSFGFNNAVRFGDSDGRFPGLGELKSAVGHAWRATKDFAVTSAAFLTGSSPNEVRFGLHHLGVTLANGHPHPDAVGDAAIANRIGINSRLGGNNYGLENALRHTVWQALLTRDVGAQAARGAADAHGDTDPNIGGKHPTIDELDSRADLFNNQVGRDIGANADNATKTPQQLALLVLDKINAGQLRQVSEKSAKDIVPTTMTGDEYRAAKATISHLDTQGYSPVQRQQMQERIRMQGQNSW